MNSISCGHLGSCLSSSNVCHEVFPRFYVKQAGSELDPWRSGATKFAEKMINTPLLCIADLSFMAHIKARLRGSRLVCISIRQNSDNEKEKTQPRQDRRVGLLGTAGEEYELRPLLRIERLPQAIFCGIPVTIQKHRLGKH
nr:hypothetical protein CFP56_30781 [Quercus suber]